nr:tyrosine-protein kinase transmembrane receptor ROR2 [Ciona intestinalis]|eukprot:XP_002130072.1 tyrosine-protein kinase transmembrane receptor ROR2 [Ciona intestinalis]
MFRHTGYVMSIPLWICVLATVVECTDDGSSFRDQFLGLPGLLHAASTDPISNGVAEETEVDTSDDEMESSLRIASRMRSLNAVSGDNVNFKCKVASASQTNLTFTWYKEDLLIDPAYDERVNIVKRKWGSRMRIKEVFTSDSGLYRCEASDGISRVQTSAHLKVSFRKPPPPGKNEKPKIDYFAGKCEKYTGVACAEFLNGVDIYVEAFVPQSLMESQITTALTQISDTRHVSEKCQKFAVPAFCYFVFRPCHHNATGDLVKGDGLCQEDCNTLKHDICHEEYVQRAQHPFMKQLFDTAKCSILKSSQSSECTSVGLPQASEDDCYNDDGSEYTGRTNIAETGELCKSWPAHMTDKKFVGGNNFCRNPGHGMSQPWCFVDEQRTEKKVCKISKCSSTNILFIALPCGCALIVIVAISLYCICCRRKPSNQSTPSQSKVPLLSNQIKVHQVQSSSIRFETNIGHGLFGPVFKARLTNEANFANGYPVAIKSLQENYTQSHLEVFNKELELFSAIDHQNVACLKAVAMHPKCLVFEHSDLPTLQDQLTMQSPANDVTKPPIDNNASHANFVGMAAQVAAGMEYLSSKNFVHRDIASRNILMFNNGTLKICNLGIIMESNASSYYTPPQSHHMFPIRWMAPESIHSWQFSDKSAVWSFGVLLWEIFSYGLQPYCGYSNHEVLDMISRRQLLTCPDQCPAKVYSLMHECWCAQPNQRPSFTEILMKLNGWKTPQVDLPMKNVQMISSVTSPSPPPEYTTLPTGTNAPWKSHPVSSSERSYPSSSDRRFNPSDVSSRASSRDEYHPVHPQHRYYPIDVISGSTDVTNVPESYDAVLPQEHRDFETYDVVARRDANQTT